MNRSGGIGSLWMLWLLIAAAGLGMIVSCRSAKPTVSSTVGEITPRELTARYGAVAESYTQWDRLRIPVTLRVAQPQKINVSGTAVMQRGKSIQLSFRFFGMEVASVYITPDSLCAIDRMHKQYISEPLGNMIAGFPVNMDNLQDLLLGRMFILGESGITPVMAKDLNMEVAQSAQSWTAAPRKAPKGISCTFTFSAADRLTGLSAAYGQYPPVLFAYSDQTATPAGPMASVVDIEAHAGKTLLDIEMEWNFSKARWNGDVDISPFNFPKGYKRIFGRDLVKIFGSF